jgi:Tol biopolymer transport system component
MKLKKIIIGLMVLVAANLIFSQYYYYGKNKVRQTSFKWKFMETEHFTIYYYTSKRNLIKKIARSAEDDYNRMSKFTDTNVKKKIPIIFYNTHIDFEQTNLYPGFLPPAAQAFAEPVAHRVVIHGDMEMEQLQGVLTHELGHIFEYAILYQDISRSNLSFKSPPLWVMEGFADFITENWDNFNLLTVRDAVLNDNIPRLSMSGELVSAYGTNRAAYDFGHVVMDFIYDKFGERGIRNLFEYYRKAPVLQAKRDISKLFYPSAKIFNFEFVKYARKRFEKFFTKENPEEYSFMVGPEFPYVYSLSHQVSPSGELLSVLTGNRKGGDLDIIIISLKDGKTIKNITPGFTDKYDNINLKFNPADGISFSWDNKGDTIAFFARKELDYYLIQIGILDGKIQRKIKVENIQDPSTPDFSPDDQTIYFTGFQDSMSYIFSIDLNTWNIKKLTEGKLFINALNISRDGKKIVFSALKDGFYKLFLGTVEKPEMAIQLTFGKYNDITPAFSGDGRTIYYSSDELDSYNICSIDLEKKIWRRYTDVKTGNFFPTEIPGEPNKVIMSTYYKNNFLLFKKDISKNLEERKIEFQEAEELPSTVVREPDTEIVKEGKYRPFKKLFLTSLPPITVGYSTDGSFLGSTYLHLTDLMADQNFILGVASYYGYTTAHLYYLNLSNRLQYYSHLFYYREPYYYPYYDYTLEPNYFQSYFTLRKLYGIDFALWYPFNRSYRAEFGVSFHKQEENSELITGYDLPFGQFFSGYITPLTVSLVGETTRFAYYGPNMGHTFRISASKYFKLGSSFMDAYSLSADFRKYFRIDNNTLLAIRLEGFTSGGDNPNLFWTGGNNTIRASYWRSVVGNTGFYLNAEFRFPLINFARTLIGNIGPIRGVFFFDLGGAWFNGDSEYQFFEEGKFKLMNGISSYGAGLQVFLFGVPLHFEWVYKWDFTEKEFYGFNFWIGFDF